LDGYLATINRILSDLLLSPIIFQASFFIDGWFYADPWAGGALLEREL
jgi:hypothetical protein